MITVTLRGEPHGKGRPRSRIAKGRTGQQFIAVYTPKETRDYERALAMAGRVAMGSKPPLEGQIEVAITAIFSVPNSWSRKKRDAALSGVLRPIVSPDCDNIAKSIDGLNGITWLDDKQIVRMAVDKFYGEQPMFRVVVRPVEPPVLA